MNINIDIETSEQCGFNLLDTTCGDYGYLPESSQEQIVGRFKYTDTIGIISLTLNKSTEQKLIFQTFVPHNTVPEYINIPTSFDGWFTVNYIVLPTKQWFDNNQDQLDSYSIVYYIDNETVYKYINGENIQTNINELIEVNEYQTTISKYVQNLVSICFLKKCFINLCKQILELRGFSKCKVKGNVDDNLIYNRDLIWMSINTISYLTEFEQLAEAQRLIEILEESCNGICKSFNREVNSYGCGCS